MQFQAAHTETLKGGCSPGHLKLPEAKSSPADRHSWTNERGDLSGSHERRRSKEEGGRRKKGAGGRRGGEGAEEEVGTE